jgi:SPP1 gp7 family putative phage head morphogenesis protein
MPHKELRPISIKSDDFDLIEKKIRFLLKAELFYPILKELDVPRGTLANDNDALLEAIRSGRISFYRGTFSGKFNATISAKLKSLGAKWDRVSKDFKINESDLPIEIRQTISVSFSQFQDKMKRIDTRLQQILPTEIADKLSIAKQFDSALWKTEKDFESSIKGITIAPKLTDSQRQKIASEWQNNMKIWITDFTKEQITELRESVQKAYFAGARRETLIKGIQKSYDVTANKAKFLARQETNLLVSKYKESRYKDAGVNDYKWRCVTGTKIHPVRPWHKALDRKNFSWNNPPVISQPGLTVRRGNPGEDFNCRCVAIPIVKF